MWWAAWKQDRSPLVEGGGDPNSEGRSPPYAPFAVSTATGCVLDGLGALTKHPFWRAHCSPPRPFRLPPTWGPSHFRGGFLPPVLWHLTLPSLLQEVAFKYSLPPVRLSSWSSPFLWLYAALVTLRSLSQTMVAQKQKTTKGRWLWPH